MNLKFLSRKLMFALIALVMTGCTAIPDAGTRLYVINKVGRVQIGNTPEQVIYLMDGAPSYVASVRNERDVFDVWDYRVGNFLYAETALILFKNNRVYAFPVNAQDLMGMLYSSGVVPDAQFWSKKEA